MVIITRLYGKSFSHRLLVKTWLLYVFLSYGEEIFLSNSILLQSMARESNSFNAEVEYGAKTTSRNAVVLFVYGLLG